MIKNSGCSRRRVLSAGFWTAAGAVGLGLPGVSLASGSAPAAFSGKEAADVITVLRWLDGARLPTLRHLRPGWLEPCASLAHQVCPVRLNDLVDLAPVRDWTPPQQLEVRLIGFDGQAPVADLGLDVLFPADGAPSLVPYRLAQVYNNRLMGGSQSVSAWGWDGRLPLRISSGASSTAVDVPAAAGVYLLAHARRDRVIDPAALAFSEGRGGALHRRLIDLYGRPFSDLGYFALSVSPIK